LIVDRLFAVASNQQDRSMERLWAPWRLSFVAGAKPPTEGDPCFLCNGLADKHDRENLIARRNPHSVVVLNRFPYNNGHLLIAPNAHKAQLHELNADEILEMQQTVAQLIAVIDGIMKPDGYNVGLNLGKAAGAGLPGHLHWHLVPRWNGDTNFMTVVSDERVIVQSLDDFFVMLTEKLAEPRNE
jgi:ATP adenylyltransferase